MENSIPSAAITQPEPSNKMLEQPPERDISEVEAEVAAQYPQKQKVNGFFRFVVYATPTFAAPISFFLFAWVLAASSGTPSVTMEKLIASGGILLMLAVIYGIGLFDALLSPLIHAINAQERRRFMLMHALKFTGYQLVIIPCGLAVLVGIAAAVCSGFY